MTASARTPGRRAPSAWGAVGSGTRSLSALPGVGSSVAPAAALSAPSPPPAITAVGGGRRQRKHQHSPSALHRAYRASVSELPLDASTFSGGASRENRLKSSPFLQAPHASTTRSVSLSQHASVLLGARTPHLPAAVPVVAVLIGVVGRIVPEREADEVALHRLQGGVQCSHLRTTNHRRDGVATGVVRVPSRIQGCQGLAVSSAPERCSCACGRPSGRRGRTGCRSRRSRTGSARQTPGPRAGFAESAGQS